ncbi:hypothetical protein TWF481_004110 [Arthrobotrys musiformis]|uniref:Uncharacterized protein n=1 Tax=Arthrobotrys musiformis TaxID=47236 RepID=A0AAV9WJ05_9PEZI
MIRENATILQKRTNYKDRKKNFKKSNPKSDKKEVRKELKDKGKGRAKGMSDEETLARNLVNFDEGVFGRLDRVEEVYDMDQYREGGSGSGHLNFDYIGSEDEEVYQMALKRAEDTAVIEPQEHDANPIFKDYAIKRGEVFQYHPSSPILRAMGVSDEVLSSDSPSFIEMDLFELQRKENNFKEILRTLVSSTRHHLLINWTNDASVISKLSQYMYLCWRYEFTPHIRAGVYHNPVIPNVLGPPLEYITISGITDEKSIKLFTRAAELPGRRLLRYQDPEQKKNRHAYFFDIKVLSRFHGDSAETRATGALLGSRQVLAVKGMLHSFGNGLFHAEISSIFLLMDRDGDRSSAMIFIQLSPKTPHALPSMNLPAESDLDKQPPGVDPRLLITSRGSYPREHPLGLEFSSDEVEPSYFEASAEYMLESGHSLKFQLYFSGLESHLVLGGLEQLGESLEDSDVITVGSILYSAWIREAGLKPILRVTFIELSETMSSLVLKILSQGNEQAGTIFLDSRVSPDDFAFVAKIFRETPSREWKIIQALLWRNGESFGAYQVVQLSIGANDGQTPFLVVGIEIDRDFSSGSEGLFGDPDNSILVALRAGTRLKAEMEVLEPRFLDDEIGVLKEFKNPGGVDSRLKQSDNRAGDRDIEFSKFVIDKYNFSPMKPLDCKSMQGPPLIQRIISWSQQLDNPKTSSSNHESPLQSHWRRKISTAFMGNQKKRLCAFSLSGDSYMPQGYQDPEVFDFAISHDVGHIILQSRFGDTANLFEFADAVWALWISVDTATEQHPNIYTERLKDGRTGLRFVTILHPSDHTIHILQRIYSDLQLSWDNPFIFPNQDTAFGLLPDFSTTDDNVARRILLLINGLREVYAIEDLLRRTFEEPYSVMNYRRRVNAVLVRWNGDIPQLVIALGHFTFDKPRYFKEPVASNFKALSYIRQRKDLEEFTTTGCEIAWSSVSSYMFDLSDYTPDANPVGLDSPGAPESRFEEYTVARVSGGFELVGCPQDIRSFLHNIAWDTSESNFRKQISPQETLGLQRLVTEEISEEDREAYLAGEIGPKVYQSYEYQRRYHPSRYVFMVRGSPFHLIVGVANDGQTGLPDEGLPLSTRIERLSRAYYDLFVRTVDLVAEPGVETRWVSMRAHDLSFETSQTIRTLFGIMSHAISGWSGFDISFMRGPQPSLKDVEEVQIGKTLLGLAEIGALGRMLSDHQRVMNNLQIARIIIQRTPDGEGVPDNSFQILVMLRPQTFIGREQ